MDEDVIQIDYDKPVEHVSKDVVHEGLKVHGCINEVIGHSVILVVPGGGTECGLPFEDRRVCTHSRCPAW